MSASDKSEGNASWEHPASRGAFHHKPTTIECELQQI